MTELTTEQKTNIQRLSDAMRAGAAIRPQTTGVLFRKEYITQQGQQICSCALGAAWEGAHPAFDAEGWLMTSEIINQDFIGLIDIERYFGLTPELMIPNPVDGVSTGLSGTIIFLNDSRKWTREAIADWLLTLV
jgi:hypothetical protein